MISLISPRSVWFHCNKNESGAGGAFEKQKMRVVRVERSKNKTIFLFCTLYLVNNVLIGLHFLRLMLIELFCRLLQILKFVRKTIVGDEPVQLYHAAICNTKCGNEQHAENLLMTEQSPPHADSILK